MTERSETTGTDESRQWFEEWFNHPLYLEVYSHRDKDEAASCIQTILSITGLDIRHPASISVLDIACGAGRHALELARLGYCVTGNDLSPFLLEEARKEARNCKLNLQLTCCDMRQIPGDGSFDLVVQLFTSFGYFNSKDDDLLVLKKAYEALKHGGWYILDLINPVHLEKTLVPQSSRTTGTLSVTESRKLENERITKTITITSNLGETLNFRESVRLYGKEEIVSMLEKTGFTIVTITGDYQGKLFSMEESSRMMLFCTKS
jgi:SAM-dependent methyltransferase